MHNKLKYIDVIVPLSVEGVFQYLVNSDLIINVGQRVIVQFGARKLYTAIVVNISDKKTTKHKLKNILYSVDDSPIVNIFQIKLWSWIAKYYMSNLGEIMNTALPSSLKLASESRIILNDKQLINKNLSSREQKVLELIKNGKSVTVRQINKILSISDSFSVINQLIKKDIVTIHEHISEKYSPKYLNVIKIINDNEDLLSKTQKKLYKILLENNDVLILNDLIKETSISRSVFKALEKKEVISINKMPFSRIDSFNNKVYPINKLSSAQDNAYNDIIKSFNEKDVCLLHGVTSSGKTEIYIKLIEDQIKNGKQVLYLLPEIALTIQIIKRLKKHFGSKVGVSHSNLNNSERVEVWKTIQNSDNAKCSIILGARSSIFLPFDKLGLIIIDEEHDTSYKQQQPSPRYHSRDAAIYLASLHKAKVLLGSATPSIETYYNAQNGKYGFVELLKRYADIKLPKINAIDISRAYKKKQMQSFLSNDLINEMQRHLDRNKQIILFQNRRGYSKVLSCKSCGEAECCKYCSVSLTHHKIKNNLRCHYCGYIKEIPKFCSSCSDSSLEMKGYGTEQICELLEDLFPDHKIQRMDHDTTRKKNAYEDIIQDFQALKIDILVGTQMIAKGFDFDNVSLVGIVDSDSMLNFPDFRSHERAFQLMSQVAGRAGRKNKQGSVYLQSSNPDHEIIRQVSNHSYTNFYNIQVKERKSFNYPPFCKLIILRFKHTDYHILDEVSQKFAQIMRSSFKDRVLGPEYPVVSKIKNYFIKNILLKIEGNKSSSKAKKIISYVLEYMKKNKLLKQCLVQIDIDPN
jgi:primosomal protein N' (replication factor Y)